MSGKVFFTSDNHFYHKSILSFCPTTRAGEDEDEMSELMIEKWNSQVSMYDIVNCLGDFSFGKKDKTIAVLKRLNGIKHLIIGNHDFHWLNSESGLYFQTIENYKTLKIGSKNVVLFHYPIAEWDRMHYGSFHLHGHTHGNNQYTGKILDVGIDNRPQKDMGLWEWDEIDHLLSNKPTRGRG